MTIDARTHIVEAAGSTTPRASVFGLALFVFLLIVVAIGDVPGMR